MLYLCRISFFLKNFHDYQNIDVKIQIFISLAAIFLSAFFHIYTKFFAYNRYIPQPKGLNSVYSSTLHEKQHFRKNAQRKYHIFWIFHN